MLECCPQQMRNSCKSVVPPKCGPHARVFPTTVELMQECCPQQMFTSCKSVVPHTCGTHATVLPPINVDLIQVLCPTTVELKLECCPPRIGTAGIKLGRNKKATKEDENGMKGK